MRTKPPSRRRLQADVRFLHGRVDALRAEVDAGARELAEAQRTVAQLREAPAARGNLRSTATAKGRRAARDDFDAARVAFKGQTRVFSGRIQRLAEDAVDLGLDPLAVVSALRHELAKLGG